MKFLKKMKDILFDEEEVNAPKKEEVKENVPVRETVAPAPRPKEPVYEAPVYEQPVYEKPVYTQPAPEPRAVKQESSFPFPEFDEDEFERDLTPPKPLRQAVNSRSAMTRERTNTQERGFDYDRPKKVEKRPEFNRLDKVETHEVKEKRKFKPSPVISPVYGVLNQDYKPEDIKNKEEFTTASINVDEVRKKAFGELEKLEVTLDEPMSTFYEEKTVDSEIPEYEKKEKVKTIDELLEDTSHIKIDLEDDFELEEEIKVPSVPVTPKERKAPIMDEFDDDDTLENDLFDLIDSMYENKEESEI